MYKQNIGILEKMYVKNTLSSVAKTVSRVHLKVHVYFLDNNNQTQERGLNPSTKHEKIKKNVCQKPASILVSANFAHQQLSIHNYDMFHFDPD